MERILRFSVVLLLSYLMVAVVCALVITWVHTLTGRGAMLLPGIAGVMTSATLGLIATVILRRRIAPLVETAAQVSAGDLRKTIEYTARDDFGELATSFNRMIRDLQRIIRDIKQTGAQVAENAAVISSLSQQINQGNGISTEIITQISTSAEEQLRIIERNIQVLEKVSRSSDEINQVARATFEISKQVKNEAEEGSSMAEKAEEGMGKAADRSKESLRQMRGFNMGLKRIGDLVKRINAIAEQTHVLAINAAIEAKRAGDTGIGFSVIANEVRRLSDDVRSFSAEITGLSTEIASSAEQVIDAISQTSESLAETRRMVGRAGTAHKAVVEQTIQVFDRVYAIYKQTEEQNFGTAQLVNVMEEFARSRHDYTQRTQEARDTIQGQYDTTKTLVEQADSLLTLSKQLESGVEAFKVSEDENGGEKLGKRPSWAK